MKRGQRVRIAEDVNVFAGMLGVITKAFPKDAWDDPDMPEYTVDIESFTDEECNEVDGRNLWFTADELEAV